MDKQHLLVVDDYDDLRELIVFALMAEGFKVTEACNGAEALEAISSLSPDLVILDIGLPDIDGIEVCKRARETTDVSILMLTGEMSADVAAQTLDAGATDYVRKPVELVELTARIRAALRGSDADEELPDTIEIGPLRLDTIREEATCGGRDLGLSGTEIRVLAYLMQNEGDVVSKDDVIQKLWGGDREPHLVEVHISAIRRKLEACDCPGDVIRTVRAFGYRFVAPDDQS